MVTVFDAGKPGTAGRCSGREVEVRGTPGSKYVLAHAPGTGKTLAAVAPLVQLLWDWEAEDGELERRYVPRALWWGLEWSRFALTRMWKLPSAGPPLLRGYNVEALFDKQLCVPCRSFTSCERQQLP